MLRTDQYSPLWRRHHRNESQKSGTIKAEEAAATNNGSSNDNITNTPQTPPRRDSHLQESQGSLSLKKQSFDQPKHPNPSSPFQAYARRVRSFSSPWKQSKSRYLLTFDNERVAQEWWALMQIEYPDTVRESPQLYSFKSDRTPARAWQNPRFGLIKNAWSYRKLEDGGEDEDKHGDTKKPVDNSETKARPLSNVSQTLSMPVLREASSSPELVRDADMIEDPFTPNDVEEREKTSFAQLSITSDRIHKSVSQTNSNMDALLEGQHANAKGMHKAQLSIERMGHQIDTLTTQQSEHDEALTNARQAIDELKAHIKSLADKPTIDNTNKINALQTELAQTTTQLNLILQGQKTAKKTTQKLQAAIDQQAIAQLALTEQLRAVQAANAAAQAAQNARLDALMAMLVQNREDMAAQAARQEERLLAAVKEKQGCDHDVQPPPRKVNRRLVGYVYSK